MWVVYLLRCADGTLYCGITNNIERRLKQHNGIQSGGAKYTRSRRPVELIAMLEQEDRGAASRLEKQIQSLPRLKKQVFFMEASLVERRTTE